MYKLDMKSSVPLYQQIVDQTKEAISTGYFKEGDQLPSVREMAAQLLVNTSTVSRSYKELESIGFISTVPGKGTFVSLDKEKIEIDKMNVQDNLYKAMYQAVLHGLTKEDLLSLYENIKEEINNV